MSLFYKTKGGAKKLLENFRSNLENVKECHHLIWPGFCEDLLDSKFTSVKKRPRAEHDQEVWLREHTISTSMYVSLMYFAMSNKYRNIDDRAHACTAFEQVFNMVASILGGFALEHVPIGSQDNQVLDLLVDTGGRVDSANLWTQDFYTRYARGAWAKDFQSEQKTWVTTRHGVGRISLAQFLCFSCDPQHNVDLRGKLSRELFNLLSEFGRLLDETVSLMSKDVRDLDHLAMACKNQGRVSRSAKTVWVETVANELWNQNDSFLWTSAKNIFYCCGGTWLGGYFSLPWFTVNKVDAEIE